MVERNGCIFEDDYLFKKYSNIWNKVSNSIKKNLRAKPSIIKKF